MDHNKNSLHESNGITISIQRITDASEPDMPIQQDGTLMAANEPNGDGLDEVRVVDLDNLLRHAANEPRVLQRNVPADPERIAPDPEEDGLSRSTSLSSLTNEFYKGHDSIGKAAVYETWNHGTTPAQTNEEDCSFDARYTYSHPPSEASSTTKLEVDMGWPSLASTQTPIEGTQPSLPYVRGQTNHHDAYVSCPRYFHDSPQFGSAGLNEVRSQMQNTFSEASTNRSIGFASFLHHRFVRSSRKRKACIASVTIVFLVLVVVAFVMGFAGPRADRTAGNTVPEQETFETQSLPKRENSSLESMADTNDKVVLASVLSGDSDAKHDANLSSPSVVATALETESKAEEEKVIPDFEYTTDKDEMSTLHTSPTAVPGKSDASNGGLFDFGHDPSSSPLLFVSPAVSPTLLPTTSHFSRRSASPAKSPTASPTQ